MEKLLCFLFFFISNPLRLLFFFSSLQFLNAQSALALSSSSSSSSFPLCSSFFFFPFFPSPAFPPSHSPLPVSSLKQFTARYYGLHLEMGRQTVLQTDGMQGDEAKGKGRRRGAGRLGGGKKPPGLFMACETSWQTDRQADTGLAPRSITSIHLRQNLICLGFGWRPGDGETERSKPERRLRQTPARPSLAMHKTNCWHKVTQRAEQGLVGMAGGIHPSVPPPVYRHPWLSLVRLRFSQLQSNGSIQAPEALTDGLD